MQNATPSGIEHNTVLRWLPDEVHLYLKHTEKGASIRALARDMGVHASTVMRQVRKTEARRDDPLVDSLLTRLGEGVRDGQADLEAIEATLETIEDDPVSPHMLRLLRAMMKDKAVMVVSQGVDTAVVLAANEGGDPVALAKGPTEVVEVMALRGWIDGSTKGRICRYHMTSEGRVALNRMLAQMESRATGFVKAQVGLTDLHKGAKSANSSKGARSKRPIGADSPVRVLGRAKGRQQPYLAPDLVNAAERLHRDFALGKFALSGTATWDRVQAAIQTPAPSGHPSDRKLDARKRFSDAIGALGPELAQIAMAVCCHERGMERVEADMSMPARSGKYMLRVALSYLARHYGKVSGDDHDLIY
ncbi:helix-turn-helix domain-containing protein [Aliiroseovarius sp. S1339]|uniref:DUF6456 domain-containing protein n=1 Tax=Aliiroseovarius sp. S1339 TaxID=2936990 RepID=UPI0020C108A8|nr:DUF6456 domain-containing protein [Aliiroseovarius sp. S1339]MCK8462265.1 helix-turn-helix domain-containing protein [Aliiroseovarius sp. S1339]